MRPLLSYTQNGQRYGKKENYKLIPLMNTDSFIQLQQIKFMHNTS